MDPNSPTSSAATNEQPTPQPTQPKKSNKSLIIIICALIGIVIIAAIIVVLLLNKNSDKIDCETTQKIIGVWNAPGEDSFTYAYNSDGTGIAKAYGSKSDFNYTISACNEINVNIWGLERKVSVEFNGNNMIFTGKDDASDYKITFKRISGDPKDIDNDILINADQATNNTERRNHISFIMSLITNYTVNNRKAPEEKEDFNLFLENYVDSEYKTDPDGTDYIFRFGGECQDRESCWGIHGPRLEGAEKPRKFNHTIYYFYSAKCGNENEVVKSDQKKSVVLYSVLDGGETYCATNAN